MALRARFLGLTLTSKLDVLCAGECEPYFARLQRAKQDQIQKIFAKQKGTLSGALLFVFGDRNR